MTVVFSERRPPRRTTNQMNGYRKQSFLVVFYHWAGWKNVTFIFLFRIRATHWRNETQENASLINLPSISAIRWGAWNCKLPTWQLVTFAPFPLIRQMQKQTRFQPWKAPMKYFKLFLSTMNVQFRFCVKTHSWAAFSPLCYIHSAWFRAVSVGNQNVQNTTGRASSTG